MSFLEFFGFVSLFLLVLYLVFRFARPRGVISGVIGSFFITMALLVFITLLTQQNVSTITPTPTKKPFLPTKIIPTSAPIRLTVTPVTEFGFCPKQNIRVRAGPGTEYNMLDGLATNECYGVVGRNVSGTWLYIGNGGWVSASPDLVEVYPPDIMSIPVYDADFGLQAVPQEQSASNCPTGCKTHVAGCDIKGNISFETSEKIYHVPGDEFYDLTTISPEQGERWFCTESEALANGWRRAQ